jgi:predicted TIM-barrel fold metal-dependent hydrolase
MPVSAATTTYLPYRLDWLAKRREPVIEPDLPIIDAHHHIWDTPRPRYMIDDLVTDLGTGHNIVATVYAECRSMYRADGPESFRTVGEIEFANGLAAMGASGEYGPTRFCAAIVGHAELRHAEAIRPVLEAMIEAGNGRFRGIRQVAAFDPDPTVISPAAAKPPGLLLDPAFQRGFACLAPLGLSFDAFVYHHQLGDVLALARAFPETRIVLDHIGGPLGIGRYAKDRAAVFDTWRDAMRALAACPNVAVKLGGLGMRMFGFGFECLGEPPSSEMLAQAWRPFVETCIDIFGVERAMFESNFPPDKGSCAYPVLWNAFKRLTLECTAGEKAALFRDTAARVYRIDLSNR